MSAVVSVAFAFEGWILTTSISKELKNSKKNFCLEKREDGKYIGMIFQGVFETFLD